MDEFFFSMPLGGGKSICISPISERFFVNSGIKGLGSDFGFFVYEVSSDNPSAGINIIAKAASAEAAERLAEIIKLSAVSG